MRDGTRDEERTGWAQKGKKGSCDSEKKKNDITTERERVVIGERSRGVRGNWKIN